MNPAKLFPWLLAGLPLVVVFGYILVSGPEETAANPTTAGAEEKSQTSPHLAAYGSRIKQLSPEGLAAKKRHDAAKQKAAESFRKVAKIMTPEFCVRAADNIMQLRQESYGKIFSSWNLDVGKSREVLGILRDREIRRLENIGNYSQDAYNSKSAKVKAFQDMSEDLVVREVLSLSIGETRATELLDMIKLAEKDEMAEALQKK